MGTYFRAKIDPSSYFSFGYPGILGNITRNFSLTSKRKRGLSILLRQTPLSFSEIKQLISIPVYFPSVLIYN